MVRVLPPMLRVFFLKRLFDKADFQIIRRSLMDGLERVKKRKDAPESIRMRVEEEFQSLIDVFTEAEKKHENG